MRFLLGMTAVILLTGCGGGCPSEFMAACAKKGCADAVKKALEKDPKALAVTGPKGITPLHVAADADIAEALIAAGADINATSGLSQTPYSTAYERDRGDVIAVLLRKGFAIHDKAYEANKAVRDGKPSVLAAYLESGVGVDDGIVLNAVMNDQVACAELLLSKGGNAKAAMGAGMTMISMGQTAQGYRTDSQDVSGKTALDLARSEAMKDLLKKHGG